MIEPDNNTQRGAIMVEAAIYFPITIAVVMAVIYFGLFKMQESYFFFQVERAAMELRGMTSFPRISLWKIQEWILTGRMAPLNHR